MQTHIPDPTRWTSPAQGLNLRHDRQSVAHLHVQFFLQPVQENFKEAMVWPIHHASYPSSPLLSVLHNACCLFDAAEKLVRVQEFWRPVMVVQCFDQLIPIYQGSFRIDPGQIKGITLKIEAIVQDATAQGVVSNIDALNFKLDSQVAVGTESQGGQHQVPSALKYFSISQKEKTVDELVQDQWLNLTPDGNITLGVRSFLDLRSWFRNNDVLSCHVCNEAGVKAEICKNEACTVRIHPYCLKQLFATKKREKVCPSFGNHWQHTVPKEEATQIEDNDAPRASQPATGSRGNTGKKRRNNRTVEEDDVAVSNGDNEQNEGTGSQHGTAGLASQKRRKTNRINNADDMIGSGVSQSSSSTSDFRRVTRSSVRLM